MNTTSPLSLSGVPERGKINMKKLYFVIGASGAGKTTATRALEKKRTDIQFCFPDKEHKIPSVEEMIKEYGNTSNWQKAKTIEWVKNIKGKYLNEKPVVLDMQTRYEFIEIACKENNIDNYKVILFDCEDLIRNKRIHTRGQPYLVNPDMDNWARFLREDSKKRNVEIMDTSNIPIEEMGNVLEKVL